MVLVEATTSEDHKTTTTTASEATKSDIIETTQGEEGGDFEDKNDVDDPKESVRSNVDGSFTVPGETTVVTTLSANDSNATTEVEVNTSIITLTTGEVDSTDDNTEDKTNGTEVEGETTVGQTTAVETTAAETTAAETTLGETTHGDTTLGETTHGDTTLGETTHGGVTHGETMTTGTESTTKNNLEAEDLSRVDPVMKEKEVSLSFEVGNETNIDGTMIKRGRILMEDDSNDEAESNRSADQARALQFNPWAKNSAYSNLSFSMLTAATILTLFLML